MLYKSTSKHIDVFNHDLQSVLREKEEGHYLIIVADRKRAIIYLFNKGSIEFSKKVMDPSVNKENRIDSGELSGRNTKQSHRFDNQLKQHIRLIIHEAEALIKNIHISGVFIGGHQQIFHLMNEELPADLQKIQRGNFITELNIPDDELIKHCEIVLTEYNK